MQSLAGHARIGIDSNVLIYLLETEGRLADAAAWIVDAIGAGTVEAVLASVGVMEILAGPARTGDAVIFEQTADALRELPIRIVGLDGALADDAAWIRGSLGIGLEDAIHLATARRSAATAFVTNDRRIRSIPHLEVLYLDDLVA